MKQVVGFGADRPQLFPAIGAMTASVAKAFDRGDRVPVAAVRDKE